MSVAYNLLRKLEWMSRRLRRIDDIGEIKKWVSTMIAINSLLKGVDTQTYKNEWRPWQPKAIEKSIIMMK